MLHAAYVSTCSKGANSITVARKSSDSYFQFHYYCSGRESEITDCTINGINNTAVGCPVPESTLAVGVVCETLNSAIGMSLILYTDCNKVHDLLFIDGDNIMPCNPLTWLGGGVIGAVLSAAILSTLFVIVILLMRKRLHRKM